MTPASEKLKKRGQKRGIQIPERPERFNIPAHNLIPVYYEEGGLRKVKPYHYAFEVYVKERWKGRTVIDVYGEFRDRSKEYYEWAIKSGAILVNNAPTTADTVLTNGDMLSNVLHRHEPPVVAGPIKIIYDGRLPGNDGTTLVVEKPGSMPIHGTGRYSYNTLLDILKHDYNLPLVHTSNRLDRLTSGIMVCSLTVEGSKKLGAWFGGARAAEGGVHKEYVARALGKFPEGEIICEEPLLTIDRQMGVNVVHPDGRESKTIFKRMSYHEATNTSVIHCRPITGRSHQIRVHLQFLGYPIANDPIYQNAGAWGPDAGKGGLFKPTLDRGSMEERIRIRREVGEKEMAAAKMKAAARGLQGLQLEGNAQAPAPEDDRIISSTSTPVESTIEALEGDAAAVQPDAYAAPAPLFSIVNKRGQLKPGYTRDDLAGLVEDQGRMIHEVPLNEAAQTVIDKLRLVKDEQDGWARWKDSKSIEKAEQAEAKALLPKGGEEVTVEESRTAEEMAEDASFCPECFVPLVPDPRPDQLFIWLHALRYKTTEWDYQSEYPYWSLDTWEMGDTGFKEKVEVSP